MNTQRPKEKYPVFSPRPLSDYTQKYAFPSSNGKVIYWAISFHFPCNSLFTYFNKSLSVLVA